ncbi:MAG: outer membrane protein assembly factor BamB family protein [Candidatus Zipacnadales bacterium]
MRSLSRSLLLTSLWGMAQGALGDWPMFRHDPARSGIAEGPAPSLAEIVWSVELDGPLDSSPAVLGDTVFATTAAGTVHAVGANTGELRWVTKIAHPIVSSPCADDYRVYFGCTDGLIYAVSATTGQPVWKVRTGRSVIAAPLLMEGKLICGSTDGRLYALNAETGELLWCTEKGGEIHAGAAADGDIVVYGDYDRQFYGVTLRDGNAVWEHPYRVEGPIIAPPVIAGQYVVLCTLAPTAITPRNSLNVHVLELATGKRVWGELGTNPWQTDKEGNFSISTCPTVIGDQVWFVTGEGYGNWSAQLRSCSLATGARGFAAQRGRPGPSLMFTDSSAAAAAGILYLADYAGTLVQFNTATTVPLRSISLGARTCSSPAISDGRVYIGLTNGHLMCIR